MVIFPRLVHQDVIFHFVGEHRAVTAVDFQPDSLGHNRSNLLQEPVRAFRAGAVGRRHKIDSVGIDLDNLRPVLFEFRHCALNQIASALGHCVGRAEVIEMAERKTQVTVK